MTQASLWGTIPTAEPIPMVPKLSTKTLVLTQDCMIYTLEDLVSIQAN
jgi:hypothetical protein